MKQRNAVRLVSISIIILTLGAFAQLGPLSSIPAGKSPLPITQPGSGTPLTLSLTLNGAGATFPQPLINVWASAYHAANPNITISYLGVGSGSGQNRTANKLVDFGASDAPLSTAQRPEFPNILHIPETIGSVTASYNVTGIGTGLNFTGAVLANIFLGNILNWNDPAIQSLNPSVTLPAKPITVVHRSDSSGTTFVWTSFLCLDSPTWCSQVGKGTTVPWPVGIGVSGNGGVATYIKSNNFTLGYVELAYAANPTHGLTYGRVQNPAGNFILPSVQTTNYAVGNATSAQALPCGLCDWSAVSLLNAGPSSPLSQTYPIASFTYFLIYQELNVIPSMNSNEGAQARAIIAFLNWVITTGQTYSSTNFYVPLHPNVVTVDQASINSITYTINSTPLSQTVNLSGSASTGWSVSSISVTSGDTLTLNLASTDTLAHQFYVDYNNNGAVDTNETWIESNQFNSATPTPFTFTPQILAQSGSGPFPHAGSFTFRCAIHPTTMVGTINVYQQQAAAVLPQPTQTLTAKTGRPTIDSSNATTVGSLLIDTRHVTGSGNITLALVDRTSGSLTFAKAWVIPSLSFTTHVGSPVKTLQFSLAAGVLPYTVSSNVVATYTPSAGLVTVTAKSNSFTRNVDFLNDGSVNIIEVGHSVAQYGLTPSSPGYDPLVDFAANGFISIIDINIVVACYGNPTFS